jgi:lysophospholipase L1-like esterase
MLIRPIVALLAIGIAAGPAILTAQTLTTPLQYTPLETPCRAVDTRVTGGPIAADTSQSFNPAGGACNIPLPNTGPIVYAINVTVIPHGPLGYLSVWPTGAAQPLVSTLNSPDGRVKANAALATGGSGGEISVYATDTTDLVLDVSGYFTDEPASYMYVPITPCRVVDTRISNGTSFGAPSLVAGQQRSFQLANSGCHLPPTALAGGGAISMNVTAVPIAGHPVSYVTLWGTSATEPQTPLVSTLNAPTGAVTANASVVTINPSTSESVSVYSSDSTDLVLDITGYFALSSLAPSGLSLYTLAPCRVLDTRESSGAFQGELTIPLATSNDCSVPASAQAYVVNATVVPSVALDYLTLWPDGIAQPVVSTLNALDGFVTSNMAIVSTTNGSIDAFATSATQLILDVSDYFAGAPGPAVAFLGDQITSGMFTPAFQAQHPLWINHATPGETSTQTLAAFQQNCIRALVPVSICHVITGTVDMINAAQAPATIAAAETLVQANILQMAQQAAAANIKLIVGTQPPGVTPDYGYSSTLPPEDEGVSSNNAWILQTFDGTYASAPLVGTGTGSDGVVTANYYQVLSGVAVTIVQGYLPGQSNDGISPNAAGYATMLPLIESAINSAQAEATK